VIKSYARKAHWNKCDFRARLNAVNVADCWRKTVPYVGTTSREGAFAELGPCPFHDGCSGMRRPELPSMRVGSIVKIIISLKILKH